MAEACCRNCDLGIEDDDYLECHQCHRRVHIKCLPHASTPGGLLGDIFFDFKCLSCVKKEQEQLNNESGEPAKELCVRQKIPWLLVISLALYNLSIKQKGLGHHGFFHWRTHIISFVDKNWHHIFGPNVRRRKQWTGSVSGALSHNSPEYFQSGLDVFQENGWWKLAKQFQTPRSVLRQYEMVTQKRQQQRLLEKQLPAADENSCSSEISVTDHLDDKSKIASQESELAIEGCARLIPYMGCPPKLMSSAASSAPTPPPALSKPSPVVKEEEELLSSVQEGLMDFLAESLAGEDLSVFGSLPDEMPPPLIGVGKTDFFMDESLLEVPASKDLFDFGMPSPMEEVRPGKRIKEESEEEAANNEPGKKLKQEEVEEEPEEGANYQPRIVQVTNYQAQQPGAVIKMESLEAEMEDMDSNQEKSDALEPCKPSGFVRNLRRNWPWLQEAQESDDLSIPKENLRQMSVPEEQKLYERLHGIISLEQQCRLTIPAYVRRLYRKLSLRKWKREHNRRIFNLDDHVDEAVRARMKLQSVRVLDRYHLLAYTDQKAMGSFHARLAGCTQYELFESPYSQRVLHPFIFRSTTMAPPWMRLMCELQHRVNHTHPTRSTIDFCYVRPQHIPAVNALLQSSFWPNIDGEFYHILRGYRVTQLCLAVSECLTYPDYSVVALYKKLVIGCGFLVPDVGYNEAYISFMAVRPNWQRSGIASFMLYHLIQTCMSKDITLHVSASNSAVMLYQKFGFKIEEIILDFYDTYLPLDSKQSRNAFFLRLQR
ncbi:hypothetical protein KR018_007286 [Drosophila ironensis]|nr:hypothetical protein KR018_007286 [Drosophila ironensis]